MGEEDFKKWRQQTKTVDDDDDSKHLEFLDSQIRRPWHIWMILASKREKLESFAQLQKARAENSANFVFFYFYIWIKNKGDTV